jgi:hypothetical protein
MYGWQNKQELMQPLAMDQPAQIGRVSFVTACKKRTGKP